MQTTLPSLRTQLTRARAALDTHHSHANVTNRSVRAAKIAAAGLSNQSATYIRQHKGDIFERRISSVATEHLWQYAHEEMFLSRVIEKTCHDVVVPYDIVITTEVQTNDEAKKVQPVPSVLNAPVFIQATKDMLQKVMQSIIICGFAVIAIPKDLPASLLADMALSGTSAAADSELRLDRSIQSTNLLPCIILDPPEGDIDIYICLQTNLREYRFVPKSMYSCHLESVGYRFEVYRPSQGTFGADYISSGVQKQDCFSSLVSQLYPLYAKTTIMESVHNGVVMDRAKSIFVEQAVATLGDSMDQTIKETVDSISRRKNFATDNLIVDGKQVSMQAVAYLMDIMKQSLQISNRDAPTNMQNCDDDNAAPPDGRTPRELASGIPRSAVSADTKTLSEMTFQFLRKTEWQSLLSYQHGVDFLTQEKIPRPPGVAVSAVQQAEYKGIPIPQLVDFYQEYVLSRFSMSKLLFGTAGGRSTTTVGGASAFKGKNTQEVAVGLEQNLYMERILMWQNDMDHFMRWLYVNAISAFDAVALSDLFKRERKASEKSHDELVNLVLQYEKLVLQLDPEGLDENSDVDDIEYKPKPPSSKSKQQDDDEEDETDEPPPVFLKKTDLREMMQQRMNMSFQAYAKTAQWLFILALGIYGNTHVGLQFKAKSAAAKSPGSDADK